MGCQIRERAPVEARGVLGLGLSLLKQVPSVKIILSKASNQNPTMNVLPSRWVFALGLAALALGNPSASADEPAGLLFRESFDDANLLKREWYDGEKFAIDKEDAKAGAGSLSFHFLAKATNPNGTHGARRLFEPGESVYLRFYLRLSKGFGWTGRNYHPHLIQFMTTENGKWHGPAASHLTTYTEPVGGKLRLALLTT